MAVLGMFFEHLYTSVNGVGKRDINLSATRRLQSPSSLTSAPSEGGPMTPDHVRGTRGSPIPSYPQLNYT